MALPLFKEKRLGQRRRLSGLMPGKLVAAVDKRAVSAKPVDVSPHGLGVIIAEELVPGTMMQLETPNGSIKLRVAWRQPDFGKRDMFRYGLVTEDIAVDLEDIFLKTNCLK